ncbi:MAG: MATE family efflux transporter [Mycoplasmatales bacterium]
MIKFFRFPYAKEIMNLFWPIAMAILLSTLLSFIDSVMISNYNVVGVSAVNIAGQFNFLLGPIFFGILTGINIFTVQYYARDEKKNLKKLVGIALTFMIPLMILSFVFITIFDTQIISIFTDPAGEVGLLALSYMAAFKYNLIFMPLDMLFLYQYRAIKKPRIPLIMSILQVISNIILNYIFIFGNFGSPELGIFGAGLATAMTRFIFIIVNLVYAHIIRAPFIGSIKETFSYDRGLLKVVFLATYPLVIVEFGFAFARILVTKIYVMTGIIEFTAYNIAKVTAFLANALVIATANISSILVGSALSRQQKDEVDIILKSLFKFMGICAISLILISTFVLPLFTPFFGVGDEYYSMVRWILVANGIYMALRVYVSSLIAILKSGADNNFVIFMDAGISYLFGIPLLLIGFYVFDAGIIALNFLLCFEMVLKIFVGMYRYRQNKWRVKL